MDDARAAESKRRRRSPIALCALLTVVVSGCGDGGTVRPGAETSTGPVGQTAQFSQYESSVDTERPTIAITRPGAVAVDAQVRRAQLASADALDMCPQYGVLIPPETLSRADAGGGYSDDSRFWRVGDHFRLAGALCLGGDGEACTSIQHYAMDWARNSGLSGPKGRKNTSEFWNNTLIINKQLLSPMLAALGVAEQFSPMARSDRNILNRWLKRKVDEHEHGLRDAGRYKGGRYGTTARQAAHNHAVFSSVASMSYGAWANDEKYFRVGTDQWFITLDSMRRDGSLPIETRRGARALYYLGRTLSALVQLAERAAVQGIDLYDRAPRRTKTLHHVVAFWINAVEHPDLVLKYARTNFVPGPSKNYKIQYLGKKNTMGWIATYVSRFPTHPNSRRLLARRPRGHSEPESYMTAALDQAVRSRGYSSSWIGVDSQCFYASPQLYSRAAQSANIGFWD